MAIKIQLTLEQSKHLKSISWLISGPRASGKSTVLALALINHAWQNKNMWIEVFDHIPNIHLKRQIYYMIINLIETDENLKKLVKFKRSNCSFKFIEEYKNNDN